MATLPTPEESGKRILSFYGSDGLRSGEMELWQSLHQRFLSSEWRSSDFNQGLKWCLEQGYLEEKKTNMYYLTDTGYSQL
ncbi:MAG: hypothetical protein ACE14V_14680 [bacterium]